jgi:hypothetical protein
MVAPLCYMDGMKDRRPTRTTTLEEEGIELHPDA